MDRREFVTTSLLGVPFLLGFKLPEISMVDELRVLLHDPYYVVFDDDRHLQIYLESAVMWLDPKGWWYARDPPKISLEDLTRDVANDPVRRRLAVRGAVSDACLSRRQAHLQRKLSDEEYEFLCGLEERADEDFHRLLAWYRHRGDEQLFQRINRKRLEAKAEWERQWERQYQAKYGQADPVDSVA